MRSERGPVVSIMLTLSLVALAVGVAVFGAIANTVFDDGDVRSLGASAIQSGTAEAFLGVLVVAVAAAAVVAMPSTPPHREDTA